MINIAITIGIRVVTLTISISSKISFKTSLMKEKLSMDVFVNNFDHKSFKQPFP